MTGKLLCFTTCHGIGYVISRSVQARNKMKQVDTEDYVTDTAFPMRRSWEFPG